MAEQKNPVSVTIKCQTDGYGFDLAASLYVDQIPSLVAKLRVAGIEPANSPYVWQAHGSQPATAQPPVCPVHGTVMKPSKRGDGWFCSAVIGTAPDGKKVYCKERGAGVSS